MAQYTNFSINLDGTADSVDGAIDTPRSAWNTAVIRSFSFWVKLSTGGGVSQGFIGGWSSYGTKNRYSLGIGLSNDYLTLAYDGMWNTNGNRCQSTNLLDGSGPSGYDIKDGNWHHIVVYCPMVASGAADRPNIHNAKMWYDGNVLPVTTTEGTANIRGMDDLSIGSSYYGGTKWLDGNITELAYWNNTELTNGNVTAIYNSGTPNDISSFSPTPTAYYRLGEKATFSTNWTIEDQIGSYDVTSVSVGIEGREGTAPNSINNGLTVNMDAADRVAP